MRCQVGQFNLSQIISSRTGPGRSSHFFIFRAALSGDQPNTGLISSPAVLALERALRSALPTCASPGEDFVPTRRSKQVLQPGQHRKPHTRRHCSIAQQIPQHLLFVAPRCTWMISAGVVGDLNVMNAVHSFAGTDFLLHESFSRLYWLLRKISTSTQCHCGGRWKIRFRDDTSHALS